MKNKLKMVFITLIASVGMTSFSANAGCQWSWNQQWQCDAWGNCQWHKQWFQVCY